MTSPSTPIPSPALLQRSPYDVRDWRYGNLVATATTPLATAITQPDVIDYRAQMREVRNQGQRGTCASFASAAMKEWQELKDIGYKSYMSPEFIYDQRENQEVDQGMYLRDVMKILSTFGSCPEALCPYVTDPGIRTKANIPQVAFDVGQKFTIQSYAAVFTEDEFKTALAFSGPCLIAFPCYNGSASFWKPSKATDPIPGGHAVLCVGYTKDGYIIRNSWGASWNDKGYTIYPYGDWGAHWEIWSSVDAKSQPYTPPVPPVPTPTKPCCSLQ